MMVWDYEYTCVTTSFARSNFADVAGMPFLRSLRIFMPLVNVSLISSSRGISMGESVVVFVVSGMGESMLEQDCWKRVAASNGVERRRDVISSVFCSISRCSDCTRANRSASNCSMSASSAKSSEIIPCCVEDNDGFIPFISNDELPMSNVRDTNCMASAWIKGFYLV
jgi:hypothetical protein